MKVLFLGMLCPIDRIKEVKSKSNYFDYPGNAFQNTLIEGLDACSEVTIVTAPNIKRFSGRYFKSSEFSHNGQSKDFCLNEYDIPGFKELLLAEIFRRKLLKLGKFDSIIIYSTSFPALYAAHNYKKKYPDVKIVNVITDLPEFMSSNNNCIYSFLKTIGIRLYNSYSKYLDAYILLAPKMIERLSQKNKPWILVEGIFKNTLVQDVSQKLPGKTILYTGALEKKYGIVNLLDAFSNIKGNDYKLYLCGDGDSVECIKQRAMNDSRIQYLGIMDRDEVLKLQQKVTLLINPRPSIDEYTMYSFPSKTIEYMASGTPVLMSRLKCLPKEYLNHLFFIDNETPNGIQDAIVKTCELGENILTEFGKKASQFIMNNKTSTIQAKRIVDFILQL